MLTETLHPELGEYIYKVSDLTEDARHLLENNFPSIWLSGEVSNFMQPASGHWYFSLKDASAQVRAVLFKPQQRGVGFTPANGMQILLRGKLSLYTPRGDFQFIADYCQAAGDGLLQQRFNQLKTQLHSEGLFAEAHKKPLPAWPKCIGVITSPTGAAVRDVITVLKRRCPMLPIIIYPTLVQGNLASNQISEAIARANQHNACDVLLLTRGGGSLEDLFAFNEENVARAIFASTIPIVSAVGHEIDFTIADFVADQRAATPSAGAELISRDSNTIQQQLRAQQHHLHQLMQQQFQRHQQTLHYLQQQLKHPLQLLQQKYQQLDLISQQLQHRFIQYFTHQQQHFHSLTQQLHQLSPMATLTRGFTITQHNGQLITSIKKLKIGDSVDVQFHDGQLQSTITFINEKDSTG